jgi:DNA-nicking Smr family endonuclease
VLIITGKGQHSGNHGPVLKTAVVQWLKKNGHPYLREFRDAPPRFGGSGAIWVELK